MELKENIKGRYSFDNGYGASVVCHPGTYGYEDGLFEVAVMHEDQLCYNSPLTNDVIGWLTETQVSDLLDEISELPEDDGCDHEMNFLNTGEK